MSGAPPDRLARTGHHLRLTPLGQQTRASGNTGQGARPFQWARRSSGRGLSPLDEPARASGTTGQGAGPSQRTHGASVDAQGRLSGRTAVVRFFQENGVRGFLHDITTELALHQPQDPRKYLYEMLRREFETQEPAQDANEEPTIDSPLLTPGRERGRVKGRESGGGGTPGIPSHIPEPLAEGGGWARTRPRASADEGQTDCLRVYTDYRACKQTRRDVFIRIAPSLPLPLGAAGTLRQMSATRARSAVWLAEAKDALTSFVRVAAGLDSAEAPGASEHLDRAAELEANLKEIEELEARLAAAKATVDQQSAETATFKDLPTELQPQFQVQKRWIWRSHRTNE